MIIPSAHRNRGFPSKREKIKNPNHFDKPTYLLHFVFHVIFPCNNVKILNEFCKILISKIFTNSPEELVSLVSLIEAKFYV